MGRISARVTDRIVVFPPRLLSLVPLLLLALYTGCSHAMPHVLRF
ncbi:glutamate receptor ionotropic, kainate 2-like, partial [Tachysurus ichikawai]